MAPSVGYAEPELPPPPTLEAVAAPKAVGPVDTPWARQEAARTQIETVKPPDEVVRPSGPPGIICPACRTENEASRRFCQSCGTPLVATAPVQVVTQRPKGRSWRWLLILVPIVIVAGVLGFGGAAFLKGGLPVGATPGPSGSPVAGVSGSPSGSPTGSTGLPSAHLLRLWSTTYSKPVPKDPTGVHSGGKTIDKDPATSFQQDTAGGRRPWVQFQFYGGHVPSDGKSRGDGNVDVTSITILPGDQSSQANFQKIRRPHHVEIWIDGKKALTAELKDAFGPQEIAVGLHVADTIQIVIADTYGTGASSTICAISELSFVGTAEP
jgi:hypothetical protein